MLVRDLFQQTDEVRVIARAIYEDRWKEEEVDGWITKYYAQLTKLKSSKVRKSDTMLYLSVVKGEGRQYGNVTGFHYKDIKAGVEEYCAIEYYHYRQYASLYVPEHTVQLFGYEAVAAEALREYGWNGYDKDIVCPEDVRVKIKEVLPTMKHELFLTDGEYLEKCRKQFRVYYEGK